MKNSKRYLTLLLITALICFAAVPGYSAANEATMETVPSETMAEETSATEADATASIVFSDDSAEIVGQGANAEGSTVSITQAGIYALSGTSAEGSLTVNAPGETVTLLLNGVSLSNSSGPAILIEDAGEATVTVQEGSENSLTDGGESEYDGALYSRISYTINGSGILNVNGAIEEGIAGEMHIVIDGPTLNITAPDDGINANNDGISEIIINSGNINITAGGDGIDSNGSLVINGGTVITMSAIDDMSGGLDADGGVTINGGTVLATGAANTSPSEESQAYISLNFTETQPAQSIVSIQKDGSEIYKATVSNEMQTLLYSDPSIEKSVEYEVYVNGELMGTASTDTNVDFAMPGGGMPGGRPPEMPDGGWPQDGERPEMPDGGWPQNGERPELPNGELPELPDGEAPGGDQQANA